MGVGERGEQELALVPVFIALGEQEPAQPENIADAFAHKWGFNELVALVVKDFGERFGVTGHDALAAKEPDVPDESFIVRQFFDPFDVRSSRRISEDFGEVAQQPVRALGCGDVPDGREKARVQDGTVREHTSEEHGVEP